MARDFPGVVSNGIDCIFKTITNPNLAAMTVGAWVKPDTLQAFNQPVFIHGAAAGGAGYGLQVGHTDGQVLFTKFGTVDLFAGLEAEIGQWQYIAAVVTATNVRFLTVQLNGATSAVDVGDANAFAGAPNMTQIGIDRTASMFDGAIAEVAVWIGDALSDANITTAAISGARALTTTLDGWWELYDDLLDGSGNEQHGIVTGTVPVVSGPFERRKRSVSGGAPHALGGGRW